MSMGRAQVHGRSDEGSRPQGEIRLRELLSPPDQAHGDKEIGKKRTPEFPHRDTIRQGGDDGYRKGANRKAGPSLCLLRSYGRQAEGYGPQGGPRYLVAKLQEASMDKDSVDNFRSRNEQQTTEKLIAIYRKGPQSFSKEFYEAIRQILVARGVNDPAIDLSPVDYPQLRDRDAGGGAQASIADRYADAYRVASAIIAFGTIVKAIGGVVAVIIAIGGLASSSELGSRGVIGGLLLGAMVGLVFWIAGVFVVGQGQLLRASLDTAVNTSPLFSNTEKAKMMGIAR